MKRTKIKELWTNAAAFDGARITVCGRKLFDPADTLAAFEAAVTPDTAAVICTHVSNVFGYVLPVDGVAAVCRARGVPLIVDASQSAGLLPVSLRAWDAAFVCMPGHKSLYGPQGTGILVCGRPVRPLLSGGTGSLSQSASMPDFTPDAGEAGKHNVPGICGLCEGIRFVRKTGLAAIAAHEQTLCQMLAAELSGSPGIRIYTGAHQAGVLSFLREDEDVEQTAKRLPGLTLAAGILSALAAVGQGIAFLTGSGANWANSAFFVCLAGAAALLLRTFAALRRTAYRFTEADKQ